MAADVRVCAFACARFAASDVALRHGNIAMQYFSKDADEHGPAVLPLVAKGLMLDKLGGPREAVANWAAANGLPQRVQRILKAAQHAAVTGDPAWAGNLVGTDGAVAIGAWTAALRTASVFYRLVADRAV